MSTLYMNKSDKRSDLAMTFFMCVVYNNYLLLFEFIISLHHSQVKRIAEFPAALFVLRSLKGFSKLVKRD